jgi:DNA-binding response OmpR family regulator
MRILLAEDDHRLAASLRRSLVEARMAVDVVHDGEEALAAGFATPHDAIVFDVMLPHLPTAGLELVDGDSAAGALFRRHLPDA